MASESVIVGLVDRALVFCRRYTPDEREAAIDAWVAQFKTVEASKLTEAVDGWIADLPEEGPASTLPRPRAIWSHIGPKEPGRDPDQTPLRYFTPPRPDYKARVVAACRAIESVVGSRTTHVDQVGSSWMCSSLACHVRASRSTTTRMTECAPSSG